jgi:DNA repair exonuclease SbcCD ATPase subunit
LESLFLDEGFGTLNPETAQVFLNSLYGVVALSPAREQD